MDGTLRAQETALEDEKKTYLEREKQKDEENSKEEGQKG
jgi:hypothetical protein